MTRNYKILLIAAIGLGIFLISRRAKAAVNLNGIEVVAGRIYKAIAGFKVYNLDSTVFATAGSNLNFLVNRLTEITISGKNTVVAEVTILDQYGDPLTEWIKYVDINAFIKIA